MAVVPTMFVLVFVAQTTAAQPSRAMAALERFLGDWAVDVTEATGATYTGRSSIRSIQSGTAHQEVLELPASPGRLTRRVQIVCLRTFDAFRGVYRFVYHDNLTGLLDVYSGAYRGGVLVLTNLESGTTIPVPGGGEAHSRITVRLHSDGYGVTLESSLDRGAVWTPVMTSVYRRLR